jgi:ABC-type nitrate/sulfonate/bicarbonate transport system substrate-binding protein
MRRLTALFLAILLFTYAAHAAAAPLRISYAAIAANIAGIWMAEGSGAFKKYGLDVQFVYIPSES